MDALINSMGCVLTQCVYISSHYVVHFKYLTVVICQLFLHKSLQIDIDRQAGRQIDRITICSLTFSSYLKAERNSSPLCYLKYLKIPLGSCACCPRLPLKHECFSFSCTESQCSSEAHLPGLGGVLGHAAVVHRKYQYEI